MYNSGILRKGLFALALVLFFGQGEVMAQEDLNTAIKMIRNEKYGDALTILKKLNANDPRNEKIDYQIGRVYFLQEKFNEAGAWFAKGQGHGQRYPMNHIGVGAVKVKKENFDGAKEALTKGLEVNKSNDPDVILEAAEAYMGYPGKDKNKQQPYLKEAELHLYKVQKLAPKNARSFVLLGKLYGLQGVEELEQSMYEKAIELDGSFIDGYFRLGQLYKKQSKYNEANSKFEKCVEIDANYAPAYRELAEIWFLAKKFDKADNFMSKYLDLMGNDKGARMRSCIFQYLGEKYDTSVPCMEEMLKDTTAPVLLRLLGYSYAKMETPDPEKSLNYLQRYFDATDPEYYIASDFEFKGMALQQQDKTEEAIEAYEKAMEMAEEKGEPRPDMLSKIADIYKAKKDYGKRAEYLARYIKSHPRVYKLKENFSLGQSYYLSNEYMMGDSVFKKMTEMKPDLVIGHSWRAKCLSQVDSTSKDGLAKPHYEKVLEIIGEDEEKKAKFNRDFLQANRYLGAYHTLVSEDFKAAIPYWEAVLSVKPEDENATNGLDYCKQKGG
ncbi:MAG: tetratricopeptide repeat protein [Bacteroidota bacterium]